LNPKVLALKSTPPTTASSKAAKEQPTSSTLTLADKENQSSLLASSTKAKKAGQSLRGPNIDEEDAEALAALVATDDELDERVETEDEGK
jgi:hypothetical protein